MANSINHKDKRTKIILLFIMIILLNQVFIHKGLADEIEDGPLKISSSDWINIQLDTNITLFWQFQVGTNEAAIYWEIIGDDGLFKTGWGPSTNCTTPILNETGKSYEYVCHGYYAKYHVWSTKIVTCTETGQNDGTDGGGNDGVDPRIFLYIGISAVSVSLIAFVVIFFYLRRKKKKDFF